MRQTTALFALLLLFSCSSGKDPSNGTIHGVITDESGAPLPGVTVTMGQNVTVTDATGHYVFANVPPGPYDLDFELAGALRKRVHVVLGAKPARLNTKLRLSVAESVTVTAQAPAVMADTKMEMGRGIVGGVVGGLYPASLAPPPPVEAANEAQYASLTDHEFIDTKNEATTTFAIDVDRASYTNVRRFLTAGLVPPPGAVRVEEMLNYFTYSYPQPTGPHPFSITTDVASCPWNANNRLLRIGIQGRNLEEWRMAPNNLVFLIDVSGSMQPPARLPLLKSSFRLLVDKLRAEDRVAIVVYAGAAGLALPSTSGADKQTIIGALDRLNAGGSTAGARLRA